MPKQSSIRKNFIMNFLLTISSFVFPLITFPYVSRILLPEGTGKVAFAVSLISYFNMFAQLGIPTYGVRVCAQVRDDRRQLTKTAHELLGINIVMSIVSYLLLAAALILVPSLKTERMLYILVSFTIILTSIGMEWLYKALEQYTYITVRSVFFKFIALIGMFLLIHKQEDYIIYGGITIFAASASNIVNFLHARKHIDWKWLGQYDFRRHLKPIGIFFAMACATTIYTYLDELMLGFMAGNVAVGYYDAATKIKKVLVSLVTSLGVVILPRASYYIEKRKIEEFWKIGSKALHFIFLIASPLMIFFAIFAKNVIYFLASSAYDGAIRSMQILMPTLLFIGITNILGIQILVPLGRENKVLQSVVIGAIVDAILNMLLIPKMGASGAAIGTLTAEVAVLIFQIYVLRKDAPKMVTDIKILKIIVALALAVPCSVWVLRLQMNNFTTVVCGAATFFSAYGASLLIMRESLAIETVQIVKNRIKRR